MHCMKKQLITMERFMHLGQRAEENGRIPPRAHDGHTSRFIYLMKRNEDRLDNLVMWEFIRL